MTPFNSHLSGEMPKAGGFNKQTLSIIKNATYLTAGIIIETYILRLSGKYMRTRLEGTPCTLILLLIPLLVVINDSISLMTIIALLDSHQSSH